MSCGKKWKTPAIVLIPLSLIAVWLIRSHYRRDPPVSPGGPATVLEGHRFPVQAVTFAPNGRAVTSIAYYPRATETEAEVADWGVEAGAPRAKRTVPLRGVRCLVFIPGGMLVATEEGSVWQLGADSPYERRRLCEHRAPVCALAVSRDGRLIATADLATDVALWDAAEGRLRASCKGHVRHVVALAFAPDGRTLASQGAVDATVCLWDTVTGEERGALRGHTRFLSALEFSPDGRTLASGDMGGVVNLWDVGTGKVRPVWATPEDEGIRDPVAAVAFSPDGRVLAVAIDRAVQLWDADRGELLARLAGHERKVNCLAYSPDGALLASGGHDCTVRLWDVARYRTVNP
jgi:WD40 repeat protein